MCSIIETFGSKCYFGWILTNLSINPMAAFEMRMHKFSVPQGSLDHCLDDPHRVGSENLSKYLLVDDRPWVGVSFNQLNHALSFKVSNGIEV